MKLTAGGRAVLFGSILVYVAGLVLGHRELVTAATVGLVAVVAAMALTLPTAWLRQGSGTITRTVAPRRVTRGDPAEARLRVRRAVAGTGWGWRPSLTVRDLVGGRPHDTVVPGRGGETFETRYLLPTTRRGLVALGPLSLVRHDPLGLVTSARRLAQEAELWVYPRVHALVPLASGRRRDLEGPTEDRAAGSITFHALREYVPGDDLRLIHWRSTARTGTLMVRQQVDPSQPHTTVVLDTRRSVYAGAGAAGNGAGGHDAGAGNRAEPEDRFEEAVDAAASLLVASTSRHFPVRLWTTDGKMSQHGRGGTIDARPLLDDLAVVQLAGDASLGDLAGTLATPEVAARSVVVVTGRPAADELAVIRALAGQLATLAIVRFDAGVPPGSVWHDGVLDVTASDSAQFAQLWRQVT